RSSLITPLKAFTHDSSIWCTSMSCALSETELVGKQEPSSIPWKKSFLLLLLHFGERSIASPPPPWPNGCVDKFNPEPLSNFL
ncbi:hypothetical protein, partial [Nostoc sp. CALU 1950]|uniref:hypothetical protein n=1 Tax=Nostoc sp. CALU 1950 TaxID=3104321 RepID=UPI003EB7CDEE